MSKPIIGILRSRADYSGPVAPGGPAGDGAQDAPPLRGPCQQMRGRKTVKEEKQNREVSL